MVLARHWTEHQEADSRDAGWLLRIFGSANGSSKLVRRGLDWLIRVTLLID